jgi:putative serine protease PepD
LPQPRRLLRLTLATHPAAHPQEVTEHLSPHSITPSTTVPGETGAHDGTPGTSATSTTAAPAETPPVRSQAAGLSTAPRTVALLAAVALVAGGVGGAVGATAADDEDTPVVPSASEAVQTTHDPGPVADVAAAVLPSVVSIAVQSSSGAGTGSGVVLDDEGHVLTNNHVVESGVEGDISVVFSDGRRASAKVVGLDPVTDLAVLDLEDVEELAPIALGRSSEVRVGDAVVAIGSPLGLSGTVTTGIVSGLGRTVRTDPQTPLLGAIQTDAAINPGNSGGALVDDQGRLIGINTAISTRGGGGSIGLGFAIPVDEARSVADDLIRTGKAEHPALGVAAASVTLDEGRAGVRLEDVSSGGSAGEAGLRAGDVVVAVDATEVATVDQLVLTLRGHEVGEAVTVTYLRDGRERTAQVVLTAREV